MILKVTTAATRKLNPPASTFFSPDVPDEAGFGGVDAKVRGGGGADAIGGGAADESGGGADAGAGRLMRKPADGGAGGAAAA